MRSGRREEAPGVAAEGALASRRAGIFVLRGDDGAQHLDGVEFVAPDAAVHQFLHALARVESPGAAPSNHRNGKGPSIIADLQHSGIRIRPQDLRFLSVSCSEAFPSRAVRHRVPRADEPPRVLAQYAEEALLVLGARRGGHRREADLR